MYYSPHGALSHFSEGIRYNFIYNALYYALYHQYHSAPGRPWGLDRIGTAAAATTDRLQSIAFSAFDPAYLVLVTYNEYDIQSD
jgi:hypothetical protein